MPRSLYSLLNVRETESWQYSRLRQAPVAGTCLSRTMETSRYLASLLSRPTLIASVCYGALLLLRYTWQRRDRRHPCRTRRSLTVAWTYRRLTDFTSDHAHLTHDHHQVVTCHGNERREVDRGEGVSRLLGAVQDPSN